MMLDTMLTHATGTPKDRPHKADPATCSHGMQVGLRKEVENTERDLGATNIVEISGRLGFSFRGTRIDMRFRFEETQVSMNETRNAT